ncbi:aldose 1-epimerase, interruption-N [Streptococcus agalactiae STIR-CD-17]|nr:aldose 1-epimerase, interruption-N [Streptococcus agalactiae STIR-CD-17]
MTIIKKNFGEKLVFLYELKNKNGMKVTLTNFGARIVDIFIPIDEHLRNISLSATSVEDYYQKDIYVGATVVPVAGRISGAKTHIKGKCYHFTENEPNRTLHSGVDTSVEQYWSTEIEDKENKIIFSLFLPDGKNGFPGNVTVIATYQLTEENELKVNYQAQSDCDTIFNPTNHVYFNLTGDLIIRGF